MTVISAETYARRCAEDELAEPHGPEEDRPGGLFEVMRALVFVGLLDRDVADAVQTAYRRAEWARGRHRYLGYHGGQQTRSPAPPRVCRGNADVEIAGATVSVRLVSFGEHSTRIATTVREAAAGGASAQRHRHHSFLDVHEIAVRADKGRKQDAHLSDSDGDGGPEWHGWYETHPGLSRDTAWIEIEGTRIPLEDVEPDSSVTVEELGSEADSVEKRATRYLEHCRDSSVPHGHPHDHGRSVTDAADALVACGALSADQVNVIIGDPNDPGSTRSQFAGGGGGWWGSPGMSHQVPTRGRRAADAKVLGVTTPTFDGIAICVVELGRSPEGFRVELEGWGALELPHHGGAGLDTPRLVFSATDDAGTRYRGFLAEHGRSDDHFQGTARFHPALPADASTVDLEFTTERTRAVVQVPLGPESRS